MKIDHIFLAYMAVIGIATGAIVVSAPWTAEFAIKPYFWILIAAALFDVVIYARGGGAPKLGPGARIFGFILGGLVMLAITTMAGITVKFI
jgi:hypothetical protein